MEKTEAKEIMNSIEGLKTRSYRGDEYLCCSIENFNNDRLKLEDLEKLIAK